jgi:branched-chain amino acid transport system ATP-binding protein
MNGTAIEPSAPRTGLPLLAGSGLVKRYGGVAAVDGIDLVVGRGEPLAVIGPNGAGKSTLLKLISGEVRSDAGEIRVDGEPHGGASSHAVARRGVGLAHQVPLPFGRLTVRENVRVGALHRHRGVGSSHDHVNRILERCELSHLADRPAGSLTLLNLKRLELARALSLDPKLLLLDEVAAGLVGRELREIIDLIAGIRDEGVTLIIVEHVERVVRELVQRVMVLDWGKVIAEGTPEEVAADPKVREVYLGSGHTAASRTQGQPGSGVTPASARSRAASPMVGAPLELRGITAGYGQVMALREIDLEVAPGSVVAVLGANGAGKTTLCRAISGLSETRGGTVALDGRDITGLPAHERARLGIAHCQEGRRLFAGMSVEENLLVAAQSDTARRSVGERRRWVEELFPILAERRDQAAQTLSGGQQQMLAIGRALMAHPRLVLFDEISLGLAPAAIDTLYDAIEEIRLVGISILLVEQNVHRSLALADRAYVLERGNVSFEGDPNELLDERRLEAAYFGTGTATGSEQAAVSGPNHQP